MPSGPFRFGPTPLFVGFKVYKGASVVGIIPRSFLGRRGFVACGENLIWWFFGYFWTRFGSTSFYERIQVLPTIAIPSPTWVKSFPSAVSTRSASYLVVVVQGALVVVGVLRAQDSS